MGGRPTLDEDQETPNKVIAALLWHNHRLLPPASLSVLKSRWDLLMLSYVLYDLTIIPLELAWDVESVAMDVIGGDRRVLLARHRPLVPHGVPRRAARACHRVAAHRVAVRPPSSSAWRTPPPSASR